MWVLELHNLFLTHIDSILTLMSQLDPEITVTAKMLERAAGAEGTRLFAAVEDGPAIRQARGPSFEMSDQVGHDGQVVGCTCLCVFDSPTGRKASIEDVVVGSGNRNRGIGRALMEHIIDFARRELAPIDLQLTSRPERVVANEMYRKLGVERRETYIYRLRVGVDKCR